MTPPMFRSLLSFTVFSVSSSNGELVVVVVLFSSVA